MLGERNGASVAQSGLCRSTAIGHKALGVRVRVRTVIGHKALGAVAEPRHSYATLGRVCHAVSQSPGTCSYVAWEFLAATAPGSYCSRGVSSPTQPVSQQACSPTHVSGLQPRMGPCSEAQPATVPPPGRHHGEGVVGSQGFRRHAPCFSECWGAPGLTLFLEDGAGPRVTTMPWQR